jgi:diguanylate cyclase (GGDEF)-like protein/PAS domain S-box-containing protein
MDFPASNAVASVAVLDALVRATHDALLLVDAAGSVTALSSAAERLTGWRHEDAVGLDRRKVLPLQMEDGDGAPDPLGWAIVHGWHSEIIEDVLLLSRDERRLPVRIGVAAVFGADGTVQGAVCTLHDLSDASRAANALSYARSHDPITGLLSRDEFERCLKASDLRTVDSTCPAWVASIDIDQFKIVNDTAGHGAGDVLLKQIGMAFRQCLSVTDQLARVGGDDFAVLLQPRSRVEAERVIECMLQAVRDLRFDWQGARYAVTVSVGVTPFLPGSEPAGRALSMAERARFLAKDQGRDRVRFTSDDPELAARGAEMAMVARLAEALDQGRFVLHCQDVVSVTQPNHVVYREFLVRMIDIDGSSLPPGQFIPGAERYHMMTAIDRWVMATALDLVARLPDDDVVYAINISGQSLGDERFLQYAMQALADSGVRPQRLCLEITETAAVVHIRSARAFIAELTARGVRFALDDFGVGMSSFGYLKTLPVHYLKIDGRFVRELDRSAVDQSVVRAIADIAHAVGMKTIAEHVEIPRLLPWLHDIGVDYGQGWGIGRDYPAMELLDPVASGRRKATLGN